MKINPAKFMAAIVPFVLAGCSALCVFGIKPPLKLSDTVKFYHSTTETVRPPKPDNAPMPLLLAPPKRKYRVIGEFIMRSKYYEYDFMSEAAVYNGRRVGADAVLLKERWSSTYEYKYYPQSNSDDNCPVTPEILTGEKMYIDAQMIVYP